MKKVIVLLFLIVFVLSGCTSHVKDDLFNYINIELPPLVAIEQNCIAEFDNLTSTEDYAYEDLYLLLNNKTIPSYEEFVHQLERITPTTDEVKKAHNFYTQGASKQLKAFKTLKEAMEEKDNDKIILANQLLAESKAYMKSFNNEIVRLAEKHNIKYDLQ